MSRGVQLSLLGSVAVAALIAVAGCGHNFYGGEREAWRHDTEIACLNSGAVKDGPERVRISAISGPGICGTDFPIRVSAFGESAPLGYDDEPLRPPGAVPDSAMPKHWPVVQSNTLPPAQVAVHHRLIRRQANRANATVTGRSSSRAPAPIGSMQATAPPLTPTRPADVALRSRRAGPWRGRCGLRA